MRRLLLLIIVLCATSCGPSDPHVKALYEGLDQAQSYVEMQRMRDGAKTVDPEIKPSSLVAYIFGAGTQSLKQPPEGVGFTPERPLPWCIYFKPDDAARVVVLEAYGEKTDTPLKTVTVTVAKP